MQAALSYIDRHREDMVQLWRNIVSMESPSADVEAVRRIASHLDTYCDAMGMQRKVYAFEHAGSTFTAQTDPGRWKPVALLGHMDTVHPVGSFGEEPFRIDGDTVYGPGTLDCKGGVVAAIYAIRALQHIGYTDRQLKLILSGDEEVAHALSDGESGRIFASETKDCAAVFNCESGFPNGEVTIRRKGGAYSEKPRTPEKIRRRAPVRFGRRRR
jgi:glutamate carboxypeptidase